MNHANYNTITYTCLNPFLLPFCPFADVRRVDSACGG